METSLRAVRTGLNGGALCLVQNKSDMVVMASDILRRTSHKLSVLRLLRCSLALVVQRSIDST